jgi:hypothetical protein
MTHESFPNEIRFIASAVAVGAAIGGLTIGSLNGCEKTDKVGKSGEVIASDISSRLKPDGKLPVAAAIIAVDRGVHFRYTPVKYDTSNASLTSGNRTSDNPEIINVFDSTLSDPTILVRPIEVKNETRISSKDPICWLGGLQSKKLVWVGVNDETKKHLHFYQRPNSDQTLPDFTQEITVTKVDPYDGIVFKSDGYQASAGLIRSAEANNRDPYLDALKQEGYKEVHPQIDC